MKLYEIMQDIQLLLDGEINPETGEVEVNWEALEMLEVEKDKKISGLIGYYKNLSAEIDAHKTEEKRIKERRQSLENRQSSLKNFIDSLHKGEKAKYLGGIHQISYRKSVQVVGDGVDNIPESCIKTEIKPVKSEIKKLLQAGEKINGWELSENINIQIK